MSAIAHAFAAEGAVQVLAGRTPERVQAVVDGLAGAGAEAQAVGLDVADSDAVEAAVAAAHERMGGLDVVVNGAAIDTGWAPSAAMELAVWDSTIAINLSGTYYVCRAAIPRMIAGCGGSILNITSVAGHKAWAEDVAYNASKAGVASDDQDDRRRVRNTGDSRQLPGARGDRRWPDGHCDGRRRARPAREDAPDAADGDDRGGGGSGCVAGVRRILVHHRLDTRGRRRVPRLITLESPELLVRVDPDHGGEILDLVHLESGRQLLGRPPFGSEPILAGDLDEDRWTRSYRGGWQTVLPNAGNPCDNRTGHHGFHGRASNDPWAVVDRSGTHATLAWEGHDLEVERRVALEDGAVRVTMRITSPVGASLVSLEHISAGLELLEPQLELALPAGYGYELSEQDGPTTPPDAAPRFPELQLLDGTTERADRWPISEPRSRLFVVAELPEGWAVIRNGARGEALAMAWDVDWYRHCWVWHENRVTSGIWREAAETIVVEPTTVPHSLGLAVAEQEGQARRIEPGEVAEPWIVLRPQSVSGAVSSVDSGGHVVP